MFDSFFPTNRLAFKAFGRVFNLHLFLWSFIVWALFTICLWYGVAFLPTLRDMAGTLSLGGLIGMGVPEALVDGADEEGAEDDPAGKRRGFPTGYSRLDLANQFGTVALSLLPYSPPNVPEHKKKILDSPSESPAIFVFSQLNGINCSTNGERKGAKARQRV